MPALYFGQRDGDGRCVVVVADGGERFPLDPRLDIRCHSPSGYEWGYGGSGPAQLALALLCHALASVNLAEGCYQEFKREVIAGLPHQSWTLNQQVICEWWMHRIQVGRHDVTQMRCRDCYEGGNPS